MTVRATLKNYRVSASKARLVVDLVRGRGVEEAIEILVQSKKRVATPIAKLLRLLALLMPTPLSRHCPMAMEAILGNRASDYLADNASASRWPERSSTTRKFFYWMRQPARWTRKASTRCNWHCRN